MKEFLKYGYLALVISLAIASCNSRQPDRTDSDSINSRNKPNADPVDSIDSASSVTTDSIDTNYNVSKDSV